MESRRKRKRSQITKWVCYALLMLLGAVLGDAVWFIAALLAAGVVVALLACVLEKLGRVEQKLDKLLEEKEREN